MLSHVVRPPVPTQRPAAGNFALAHEGCPFCSRSLAAASLILRAVAAASAFLAA